MKDALFLHSKKPWSLRCFLKVFHPRKWDTEAGVMGKEWPGRDLEKPGIGCFEEEKLGSVPAGSRVGIQGLGGWLISHLLAKSCRRSLSLAPTSFWLLESLPFPVEDALPTRSDLGEKACFCRAFL